MHLLETYEYQCNLHALLSTRLTVYHFPHFLLEPVIALVGAGAADSAVETLRLDKVLGSYEPPGTLSYW